MKSLHTFSLCFAPVYVSVLSMGATSADIFSRALTKVEKRATCTTSDTPGDNTPKYIPLHKIVSKLKKTGSVTETAKILGIARQTVYDRLQGNNIDHREFTDYTDDKALSHEILQYRLNKGLTEDKIKKMNGGSTVLAICQLDDKIARIRDGSSEKGGLQVIINLANRTNEIDITPA